MTGRFAIRSGTMKVPRGGAPYGLTQWEITLAELLSAQGYATGHFGKWHLGDVEGRYPTNQGFDEWYGIPNTTDESLWIHPFVREYTPTSRHAVANGGSDRPEPVVVPVASTSFTFASSASGLKGLCRNPSANSFG